MQTYIVQTGDTLFGIAKQFGLSIDEIKRLNNLTSNTLIPGQRLKLPMASTNTIYIVKPGDNLYTIAKNYNTTVEALLALNRLTSNALFIGQQLQIPSPNEQISQTQFKTYIVQAGDSLYKIARSFDMTVEELLEINNLNNSLLTIGQILKVNNTPKTPPSTEEVEECFGTGYQEPSYETYTVQNGDNLYTIAKRFNTTVNNLLALNNLVNNNLSIGQILKIREVNR